MAELVAVGDRLTDLAAQEPDRPALTCDGVTVSRHMLEAEANRAARDYRERGVGPGDLVTVALPNGIAFFESVFAIWKLGAVPQPVSYRLPDPELRAIVELAGSVLVVGVEAGRLPGHRCLPVGHRPSDTVSASPIRDAPVPPSLKAPTSGGSTGRPKLIVSSQPGRLDPTAATQLGLEPDDTHLVPGPLYHNAPFTFAIGALLLGNHLVVLPRFDPVEALMRIEQHAVRAANFVPTMLSRMLRAMDDAPGRYDVSSLRRIWHMAAPCPGWVKERWIALLGPDAVYEMYGGTEAQAMTAISGSEWLSHRGSVGRPVFGDVKVVEPDGATAPPGVVGEIYLRPPSTSGPTYRYIGANAERRDGWETLGDLGWMDEEGYLYLSDRRADLIISGGANIYPAEVEVALTEHPSVVSAVVVGLPDDDRGQSVHAVVETQGDLEERELRDFLLQRLVPYKVPVTFRFVRDPLRDDAGKVRRAEVRDREAALRATVAGQQPSNPADSGGGGGSSAGSGTQRDQEVKSR